jgi:hypothetical protein
MSPAINLRKENVIFRPKGWLGMKFAKMGMSMKKFGGSKWMDLYVKIKSGENISEPIKDLIYKSGDGFKTYLTRAEINDEIPTKFISTSSTGKPYSEAIYDNGTGRLRFIKVTLSEVSTVDVRANDVFEKIANKILAMLDGGKFQAMLMAMFIGGMVSLGIFNLLSYMGIQKILTAGIEAITEGLVEAAKVGATTPVAP